MKTVSKVFALLLALTLVLSLAVPAFATNTETPQTYQITINASPNAVSTESASGHIYEAYQILSGTVDPDLAAAGGNTIVKLGDPEWGVNIVDNVTAFLDELKANTAFGATAAENLFSSVVTAEDFVNVISAASFTSDKVEKVAHIIEKHLHGAPVNTSEESAPPYHLNVPAGYYLIKDKDGSLEGSDATTDADDPRDKDYTDIILQVSKTMEITHKGSVPTVSKEVSENNSDYKEYIDMALATDYYYKLIGTLPSDFNKYDSYTYTFVDTLSEGIDFVGIHQIYAQYSDGSTVDLTPSNYVDNGEGNDSEYYDATNRTVTIHFTDLKHDNNAHHFAHSTKIIVVYKARLNENAVISGSGNDNDVYLNYSNDPQGTGLGKTTDDKTKVYTFGIQLHKYDGQDTTKNLKDVKFVLFRKAGAAETPMYAIVENGVVTGWVLETALEKDQEGKLIYNEKSILTTDVNGLVAVKGLDTGKSYYLRELETNQGYHTIEEDFDFILSPETDGAGKITGLKVNTSNYYNAQPNSYTQTTGEGENTETVVLGVTLNIPNTQGVHLPSTGGVGTTLFYIIGSILVVGAVVLLITKKRMG